MVIDLVHQIGGLEDLDLVVAGGLEVVVEGLVVDSLVGEAHLEEEAQAGVGR